LIGGYELSILKHGGVLSKMKIKRMVKRLFAVASGATMLGATAMGALAADLGDYPSMFVTDGQYNGLFVVGEKAASVDNLAMTDIATSMKVAGSGGSSSTTVSGDAWMVGTTSKKLELVNSNATASALGGETFRDITTFIGEDELGALADGTWATNENDYEYQQFIFFDDDGDQSVNRIVKYTENDNDESADNLFFKSGRQIGRYKLEFTSTAQSDVTDTSGTADVTGSKLDDFENTDLTLMGAPYTVVLADRPSSGSTGRQHGAKLTLMGGSSRDTLLEGESQTYAISGKSYDVALTFVDADEAKFVVNGQQTNKLKVGETHVLSDKSEIGVSEILYQNYAGGVHSATFFVGASKLILQDTDVSAAGTGEKKLRVGSEDIDGTLVTISGTDDNTTFTITTIELNMTADDDYFVGDGQKLSDVIAAAGEENEALMNGGFDIEYNGLTEEETADLRLKSSSSRRYKLQLFDGDSNSVDIPLIYADTQQNLSVGEETQLSGASRGNQKRLHINETASGTAVLTDYNKIYKDDYFLVTGSSNTANPGNDGSAKSYLLQYKGSDKSSDTSPKIQFKNMGSSETLSYSATTATTTETVATIKLGGHSFIVQNASVQTADDYQVIVDLNGGGTMETNAKGITFVDAYGSEWAFDDFAGRDLGAYAGGPGGHGNVSTVDFFTVTQTTPNTDDYDNSAPANVVLNITGAAGPEVRAAITGVTLTTPDGETEVSYGWTSMGSFIKFDEPSSDPDAMTLTYPMKQRLPQVYFTSGATSKAKSSSGSLVAVQVVDATKLDTEVASVDAQNVIAVGGPCVNTVSAELLNNPADCTEGFTPGRARVKVWEHANGNVAMLVAGYSGDDTRLAGQFIAHRWDELSGEEAEIEGTTYQSATVGAPSAAPAAPAADAMEKTG
jgi:hypothetical protein